MLSNVFSYIKSWLTSPARWLSAHGRIAGLSLPARVMGVLFVFLTLCVVGFYVARSFNTDPTAFATLFEVRFIAPLILCLIGLPIAAYYATRFWLETPPSDFPDIDEAWNLGVQALSRAGVDIRQLPLYFTLGVTDAVTADHVMEAAGWKLLVPGEPSGARPLRWYATKDAIMLFLLDVGATSKLHSSPVESPIESTPNLRGTLVGSAAAGGGGSPERRGIRGTVVAADFDSPSAFSSTPAHGSLPTSPLRGTMLVGASSNTTDASGGATASPLLDRAERSEQARRVARVSALAAGTRLPLCPLNGVLGVIDWTVLLSSREGQLSTAVRADYDMIVAEAKINIPLILLVNGLDIDSGFIELVRRVGEDRAKNNRFGQGFSHLIRPTHEQMIALSAHASAAFEDWIYDLFKHPDALERSNNDNLFNLLCKTRNELRPRLAELLSGLVNENTSERGVMLAGCYFGAAGRNNSRQAFVRSVVSKLVELEDDIEWTAAALAAENRLQGIIRLAIFVNAALVIFILSVVAFVFLNK